MKPILLIASLMVAFLLHAQEAAREPAAIPPEAAQTQDAQTPPTNVPARAEQPASVRPGHPLDPHDVDVLTGKIDGEAQAQRYGRAQVYWGDSGYNGLMSYGRSVRGGGMFRPFLFGAQPFFFHSGFFFPRPRPGRFFGGPVH
jgi:hypothetical protein